jgi:hypothetical protein
VAARLEPEYAWQLDGTRELFIKSHSTYGILPYPQGNRRIKLKKDRSNGGLVSFWLSVSFRLKMGSES